MASGYTNTHPRDSGSFYFETRFYWESSYNASTNTSTVSFRPQIYTDINMGNDLRMFNYSNNDSGVYRDGSKIYSFSTDYGSGNYLRTWSNPYQSWVGLFEQGGAFPTLTVAHDRSGNASIKLGLRGTVISLYDSSRAYSSWIDNGYYINLSQSAPYAISYNANGGSGAPSSQSIYATYSYTLSSTRPTRTGYTFLGWSTSSTATSATYQPSQSVTPNGNLSLYAVWKKNTYILSISQGKGTTISVLRNGSSLSDGDTLYYGDILSISISANTGYNISTHTVNGTNWTTGNFTVTQAVTVIATATLISYTLSIITSSSGVVTQISRVSSPIGEGSIGEITNGATLYYNDVLSINYTLGGAYQLISATVNNIDISDNVPYSLTVNSNVVVNISVKLGAIVYIGNEAYQAFIGTLVNGNVIWQQYQAFIGNGSTYDQY
jgi:uncharacterized repeat protein (TIGR02543 family)